MRRYIAAKRWSLASTPRIAFGEPGLPLQGRLALGMPSHPEDQNARGLQRSGQRDTLRYNALRAANCVWHRSLWLSPCRTFTAGALMARRYASRLERFLKPLKQAPCQRKGPVKQLARSFQKV